MLLNYFARQLGELASNLTRSGLLRGEKKPVLSGGEFQELCSSVETRNSEVFLAVPLVSACVIGGLVTPTVLAVSAKRRIKKIQVSFECLVERNRIFN